MYWADKLASQIVSSKKYTPYWVDDMKTPSGFAHVGSLRGPLIHSVIYRALRDATKEKVLYTFVSNDFDSADELPPEFREELKDYMGFPLRNIPSPKKGFSNLAELLAEDLASVMKELGCEATYLSSWDLYHQGKFDGVIKEALDNAGKIQDIYAKISGSKKKESGWLPFQAICEKCGKIGTNKVTAWDGKTVTYKCEPDLVTWAKGCGHEGKVSPYGGTGKLPWKIDWAAHWKVIGVTVEAAGKDHASAGGSYDIALTLCDEVFKYPRPYKFGYEFFLIGGRKMSSSKGLGVKAHDITKFLPPEIARFLFVRTNYKEQIDFDPQGTMAIPDLFDEYDRSYKAFISKTNETLARTFELSQISKVPSKKDLFLPRFRDVANYMQLPDVELVQKFEELKGSKLSKEELAILAEREKYAKVWIETYAPKEERIEMTGKMPQAAGSLSKNQKEFLSEVSNLIQTEKVPEVLQEELYKVAKAKGDVKSCFSAIYICTIGLDHGPRAAWFLLSYPKDSVIKRLKEASE